jgi:D-alanine-D-alanine ligase
VSDRWVAVLSGGLSHEREVSLRSGRRLSAALRRVGMTVAEWDADSRLLSRLREERPDAVVIALHGGEGENGAVQSVLEMLDVPYVGTDSRACRRAWDKPTAKAELTRAGLLTPDWVVLPHATFRELGAEAVLDALVGKLGLPLMLKPHQGGSALGARLVREAAELPSAMVGALSYGDTVLVERFIEGTEVAVGVIEGADGPQALPAVQIEAADGIYDYTARYTAGLRTCRAKRRLRPESWRSPPIDFSGSATCRAPTR